MKTVIRPLFFAAFSLAVGLPNMASAQNVPRLYTNGASCAAIKAAINQSDKIVLRFTRPRSTRVTFDLFYKFPNRCDSGYVSVPASVPSAGGSCTVKYQCVRKFDDDDDDEDTGQQVVIIKPPVVPDPPADPPDDGCGGCESEGQPM